MKQFWIDFRNFVLFASLILRRGTPLYLWSRAWREVKEAHLAEVRKAIWELKKEGKVREDKNGRLWIVKK